LVVSRYLEPLGVAAAEAAYTDVVPWYFVKSGSGSQREAIVHRFAPIAAQLGVPPGDLPSRPSPRALVELASGPPRRESLRSELVDAGAPLVVALGKEALDAVRAVSDSSSGLPERLSPLGYGEVGEITVVGVTLGMLPLVHPGFASRPSSPDWADALGAWTERAPTLR